MAKPNIQNSSKSFAKNISSNAHELASPARHDGRHQLTVEQTYDLVIKNLNDGDYLTTEQLCNAILKVQPNHVDTINVLGVVAQRLSRHDRAVDLFQRVISIDNNHQVARLNLGASLLADRRFVEAEAVLRFALKRDSQNDQIFVALGVALKEQKKFQQAIKFFQNAIDINPNSYIAHNNIASVFIDVCQYDRADTHFRHALKIAPDIADIQYNFGSLLSIVGNYDDAICHYRAALSIDPEMVKASLDIARIYTVLGKLDAALELARNVAANNVENAEVLYSLSLIELLVGNAKPALDAIRRALFFELESDKYWRQLVACYHISDNLELSDVVLQELRMCLQRENIDVKYLRLPLESLFNQWSLLSEVVAIKQVSSMRKAIDSGKISELFSEPILLGYLHRMPTNNQTFEEFLTRLRCAFLQLKIDGSLDGRNVEVTLMQGLVALAGQNFLNEYIFFVTPEEQFSLIELERIVQEKLKKPELTDIFEIVLLACYKPLFTLPFAAQLLNVDIWSGNNNLQALFKKQIIEPLEEAEIKKTISSLTKIDNGVSKEVREQYEEHPYPRWVSCDYVNRQTVQDYFVRQIPLLREKNEVSWPSAAKILIAGCGSGQHPIQVAMSHKNVHVTAIDLSRSSLAYAIRKSREMNIDNISFAQADILQLKGWEEKFDIIECAGVLHHMAEPMEGWRILESFLKPGGFMNIGLYSEIGRQSVVKARKFIGENSFQATADGIRAFRQKVRELPEDDPTRAILGWGDFSSLSTCRDLLFHVQEHRFTIPRIKQSIAELDLEFLGFFFGERSKMVHREYLERFPEDTNLTSLDNWQTFENENHDTFRKMYQFWLMKGLAN
ncbi:MAG: tetratricopeptide repeat protein [Magnetococcales bacterium]|nr:tetratricopeptide repeat protein [Magnetococcales bacterium]